MKQKRMMRKTAPLITPWDSGLRPNSKQWKRKRKGAWSLTIVRVTVTQSGLLPRILFCLLGNSEFVHREEFTTARRSDTQRSHSVPPRIDNSITHTPLPPRVLVSSLQQSQASQSSPLSCTTWHPTPAHSCAVTHICCRLSLLRSWPQRRAAIKWLRKAGMRVTVATKPSSEPIKFTSSGSGNSGKAHMVTRQGPPLRRLTS